MKFITLFRPSAEGLSALPDSVGLPSWRPLFVPDFATGGVALPMMALKIGRLGKCVEERFAMRYVAATAPAIQILSPECAADVRAGATPPSALLCFDSAVVCGTFSGRREDGGGNSGNSPDGPLPLRYRFRTSRSAEVEPEVVCDIRRVETAVALASLYNTVKTGDVILLPADSEIALADNLIIEAYDSESAASCREDGGGVKLLLHSKIK